MDLLRAAGKLREAKALLIQAGDLVSRRPCSSQVSEAITATAIAEAALQADRRDVERRGK
jgi:hypothetical protein